MLFAVLTPNWSVVQLSLADLRRDVVEIPIAVDQGFGGGRATVVTHDLSTSGIVYFELELDIGAALDFDTDLPLLPLFTRLLLETGAGELDRVALSQRIGSVTGGIGASMSILPMNMAEGATESIVTDPDSVVAMLSVQGKATGERVGDLLGLVHTVLTQAHVDDRQRVIEILRETRARMKSAIVSSGHSYAMGRIAAQLTLAGYMNEQTGGLEYYDTLGRLLAQAEDDGAEGWPLLCEQLLRIRTNLLAKQPSVAAANGSYNGGCVVNITAEAALLEQVKQQQLPSFLSQLLPGATASTTVGGLAAAWGAGHRSGGAGGSEGEGYSVATQVNYVGLGGKMYTPGQSIHGSSAVASKMLRTGYLWEQVRVIGGAYGGMCQMGRSSGSFLFGSYRDPNLVDTLDVYRRCGEVRPTRRQPSAPSAPIFPICHLPLLPLPLIDTLCCMPGAHRGSPIYVGRGSGVGHHRYIYTLYTTLHSLYSL
jgi:Zn-dependent M16 (insulinase) family peptidase